jgi:hypothetical protein
MFAVLWAQGYGGDYGYGRVCADQKCLWKIPVACTQGKNVLMKTTMLKIPAASSIECFAGIHLYFPKWLM